MTLTTKSDYRYSLYDPDDDYAPLYSFFHDFKIRNLEGQVVGIAGLGLSYDKFHKRVKGLRQGMDVSFLDREGRFRLPLYRREESLEALYGLDSSLFSALAAGQDKIEWVLRRDDGRDFLILIRYLPEIQRNLLIELDVSAILKDFKKKSLMSMLAVLLLSLCVVAAALLIYWVSSRHLSARVYQDTLTGCYNREYLERHLSRSSGSAGKQIFPTLIIFDIDYFKEVNDKKGHKAGDRVLKKVTHIVRWQLRSSDIIIRWGGDEFILLLYSDDSASPGIAERIRACIEEETEVTISAGVSRLKGDEDFSLAFDRADEALYKAKEAGRNRIESNI